MSWSSAVAEGAVVGASDEALAVQGSDRADWLGGSALAVACVAAEAERGRATEVLVLAVGHGVSRRLPTAARAVVAGVAPLGGRFAEGQVGGELAVALDTLGQGLVVRGRARGDAQVLVVEPGAARLVPSTWRPDVSPAERLAALEDQFPGSASICAGPAAFAGVPFASLASGVPTPSFVGRGGLGLRLSSLGLSAICVRPGPAREVGTEQARQLGAALLRSPRLAARAEGGTLELLHAFSARGDLGRADGAPVPGGAVAALIGQVRDARAAKHGCRGCPTPCGLSFRREQGGQQRARFGASDALGTRLGLHDFDRGLDLLARCDALGLDAKETGAALAVYAELSDEGRVPGTPGWGESELLKQRVDELLQNRGVGAELREGAAALARRFGVEARTPVARGQAVRPVSDLAGLLGQCVSSGGGDPMRSFPFLAQGGSVELLREFAPDLELPAGTEDPADPAGKGALVFWHENLAAAIDAIGFCAFSAAGLLADRVLNLDELARAIGGGAVAESVEPGRALLAEGQRIVAARRALDAALGHEERDPAPFAAEQLAAPGMLDLYLSLRSGRGTVGAVVQKPAEPPDPAAAEPEFSTNPGRLKVTLHSSGALAEALGEHRRMTLTQRLTWGEVLEQLLADVPDAAQLLAVQGRPIVGAWRAGRLLRPTDRVQDGDRIELVAVISGG